MKLIISLLMLPGLVIGLTVHEFAHAWSAYLLGDGYARRQGRLSLNPLRHLSPLGTLAIFLLPIGWAKPVPVNLYNFRRPKRDYLITSLAGPAANLIVLGLCLLLMQWTRHTYRFGPAAAGALSFAHIVLMFAAIINTVLAAINLLPIPPLDGSKIWPCVIPGLRPSFGKKTIWIFVAALAVLAWSGGLRPVIDFTLGTTIGLTPRSDEQVYGEHLEQGSDALLADRPKEALGRLDKAIAINPYSAEAHYQRAGAKVALRDNSGALADMNRVIELDANVPEYFEYRAEILTLLQRDGEAERDRARAAMLRGRRKAPSNEPAATRPAGRPGGP
jgi:Zn-dependent protease